MVGIWYCCSVMVETLTTEVTLQQPRPHLPIPALFWKLLSNEF